MSHCPNYALLEKAISEISEEHKENKRALLGMLEEACEGNREQANIEKNQGRLSHETP